MTGSLIPRGIPFDTTMPNDEKKVPDYPADIEVMRPDGDLVEDQATQV